MKIVYSSHYDINFGGLEKLHPFDSKKYSRAWKRVPELHDLKISVPGPAADETLLTVHKLDYLESLKSATTLAQALELAIIAKLPVTLTNMAVLRPMRYGVAGTLLGAQAALEEGLVFNLSGGYHHAKPNTGEGFCLFNDIAIAINAVCGPDDTALYVDLDAHMGNGVAHCFLNDPRVKHFDMYNGDIYPHWDIDARDRIDGRHKLKMGTPSKVYMETLQAELPGFLDAHTPARIAIYNAGTDPYFGDSLGGLKLSVDAILERDLFVLEQLRQRNLPTLVLPSGGYSEASHRMIATTLSEAARRF
ncbi:MAG: histone deacetylase [Armatimonas sp.]